MRALILAGISIIAISALADEPLVAPKAELHATLTIAVNQKQIAGVPIIFELTVKDSGTEGFTYWRGGPGRYPPATGFEAVIVDEAGKETRLRMTNGQCLMGSGQYKGIGPGQTSQLPAAISGLPAGKYTIKTITGEASQDWPAMEWNTGQTVQVQDDAPASDRFGKELLQKVHDRNAFAQHVATAYDIKIVIDGIVRDLESADSEVVRNAAEVLGDLREFPKGLGLAIHRAMKAQLAAERPSTDAMSLLAHVASSEGSDDSLSAVLAYVDADVDRSWSVWNLKQFKQDRATARLRQFLKSGNKSDEFDAAVALSVRRDPAAIPALITVANDQTDEFRLKAFLPLSMYWDNQAAMASLRQATKDADQDVRNEAELALKNAEGERDLARKAAQKK